MKIIQINGSYGCADSTGRNTKEMHLWLKAHGHSSIVYTTQINDDIQLEDGVYLYCSPMQKKIHAVLSRVFGLQGYFSKGDTRKLIQSLEQEKPDGIILGVLHNNSINFPLLCRYLAKKNIPTVLVLHDCWYYTGHCCYYTEVCCDKWKGDCKRCPQIHQWNASWWFDTAQKCLRDKQRWFSAIPRLGVVGVSDWITEEAKQSILKNAKIVKRIYNWIDLDVFKPRNTDALRKELKLEQNQKVLLGVASGWSDKKGLAEILELAKEMPKVTIILIGKTPAHELWPSNIRCIGMVKEPAKLAAYYALADVFLNPSKQETFGKTTAEAIACGTPVVAYDTTACTELVGQGCGFVVENQNAEAFVKAVSNAIKAGKNTYREVCLDFATRNFSMEQSIREYITLFEKLQRLK